MIKIGIVEDNELDRERLIKLINEYFPKNNIDFTIKTFTYADSFLNDNDVYDLVFLDIFLGGSLTGMDIAKKNKRKIR